MLKDIFKDINSDTSEPRLKSVFLAKGAFILFFKKYHQQ